MGEPDLRYPPIAEPPPSDAEFAKAWPRFRGPGGLGISAYTNVPDAWDAAKGKGILWKTPVPLPGNNSPVVWGKRVFLSGADERRREVYCFDADSGKLLWRAERARHAAEQRPAAESQRRHRLRRPHDRHRRPPRVRHLRQRRSGRVRRRRQARLGEKPRHARKQLRPCLVADRPTRTCCWCNSTKAIPKAPKSKLLAFDSATGNIVWQANRPVPNSWSSPIVVRVGDRDQIIASGDPWVIAYNPADGAEIWRVKCLETDIGPSPVFADGRVFVANDNAVLSAIRADGHGDVTATHVAVEGRRRNARHVQPAGHRASSCSC